VSTVRGAWIERAFFEREPIVCARDLIGCELVWGRCSGIIVETEAYTATGDPASHTFTRPSAREFVAKHRAGAAYVYFNYGMYWLLNVLVKGGSEDGFVLLRAMEPSRGIAAMTRRRLAHRSSPLAHPRQLCSGPGKLTLALGVDGNDHGTDLCRERSVGFRHRVPAAGLVEVVADGRIGISRAQDFPWRFTLRGSEFVSVKAKVGSATQNLGL
jgi:DNA-3-methyladenine glycosylase